MKKLFITVLAVMFMGMVYADNNDKKSNSESKNLELADMVGTITDISTGEALVGVEVKLTGTDQKVYSDFDGKFCFKVVPGNYKLETNYISYEKNTETLNVESKENQVSIKLQASK